MSAQRLEQSIQEQKKSSHLDIVPIIQTGELEVVKEFIQPLLPLIHAKPFNKKKFLEIRDTLYAGLIQGIEMCTNTNQVSEEEKWQITLLLFHELIEHYPTYVHKQIFEDEKSTLKHDLLQYDLVPSTVSTLPAYSPLNALWQNIFLHFMHILVENPNLFKEICLLVTKFSALGWGRNLVIKDTPEDRETYFRGLSPSISAAMDEMVQEKTQQCLNDMLSSLVRSLSAGKEFDDAYLFEGSNKLNQVLGEHALLPTVLIREVAEYVGFFSHRTKPTPQVIIASDTAEASRQGSEVVTQTAQNTRCIIL